MKNLIETEVRKGVDLAMSHGPLHSGKGMVSGMLALLLANFCLLGVLMFQFPTYLSTPKVRDFLSFDVIRLIIIGAMLLCAVIAGYNLLFKRVPRLSGWALLWLSVSLIISVAGAALSGRGWLQPGPIGQHMPYLGVDWLILDLLATALVFTTIEKIRPLKPDLPVFRKHWQTDFAYFVSGHLLIGLTLFLVYAILYGMTSTASSVIPAQQNALRAWVGALPFGWSLLLLMLITDFLRYWLHRFYHETAIGWRLHAIHHSAEDMDWISGTRTHGIETVLSTVVILTPAFMLGFPQSVINVYILIAGAQAVFNHTNVSAGLGPLRYILVTPNFHHWHHSQDEEGLDRCYAAHFPLWDYLFGTAVKRDKNKTWPNAYGVLGDYVPQGFLAQQVFPFMWSGKWVDETGKERRENT